MKAKDRDLYLALAHEVRRARRTGSDATLPVIELRGHLYRATARGPRWLMPSGQKTASPALAIATWLWEADWEVTR